MDRFYYLPAVSAALVAARSAQICWHWLSLPDCRWRPARLLLPAGVAYLFIANLSAASLQCLTNHRDSHLLEAAFLTLQESDPHVPRGSLVVLKHPPNPCYGDGMGIREMVCLGLNDETAVGIVQGQQLSPRWVSRLHRIRRIYVLDVAQQPLALCPHSPPSDLGQRAISSSPPSYGDRMHSPVIRALVGQPIGVWRRPDRLVLPLSCP
jgi:hypothetical protein